MVPTKPDFQPCPEDDDFMAALDKMVNENIAESKNIGEPQKYLTRPINAALRSAGQESAERADGAGGRRQGEEELGAAAAGEQRGRGRAQDRGGPGRGQCAAAASASWSLYISVQVQVMLRRGAKGGAGVRSVQVN